jgi:hypothetical protein
MRGSENSRARYTPWTRSPCPPSQCHAGTMPSYRSRSSSEHVKRLRRCNCYGQCGATPPRVPGSIERWKVRWTEPSSRNSLGSAFHWQQVRRREITPSRAWRWSIGLRPVDKGGPDCQHRLDPRPQSVRHAPEREQLGSGSLGSPFMRAQGVGALGPRRSEDRQVDHLKEGYLR